MGGVRLWNYLFVFGGRNEFVEQYKVGLINGVYLLKNL